MKNPNLKKLFQKCGCAVLGAAMALCAVPGAAAEEAPQEHQTVRVAFPTQSGMSEVGESGDLQGYNYSYLQNLAEYAGWDIEYVTYEDMTPNESIMAAMEQVMSGEVDLLGPILWSEAVEEMFEFPENNYGVVYTTLCALEKSNLSSVNFAHCKPLRVAVYAKAAIRNEEVEVYLDQLNVEYELVECETTEEQFAALETGKADVLSSITLSYFAGTRSVAQFAPRPYYFVSTKGNTELIDKLDAAVEKINYTRPLLQEELQQQFFGDTSGGYVLTDDETQFIAALPELKTLCMEDYAPYCSRGKDGEPVGVLVSLLDGFAAQNDIKLEYEFCNDVDEMNQKWKTGGYDCIMGLPFTPAYCIENGLIRTAPVLTTNIEVFGKSQNKPYAESTVAVYREFALQPYLDSFAKVEQYPTLEACFEAVYKGKADYGCANQLSVDYEIFSNAYPFVATPLLGEQLDMGMAVSIKMDSRFLSALNKYITTLPENTVTAYLSEATRHDDIDSFVLFVRSRPLLAALVLALICVVVAVLLSLLSTSAKRKKWNDELQKANTAMREATAAKSEFLSRMSHDIRTPMNAILGFAELGKQDAASPELVQDDLEKIRSSGEFLLGLVNDVLDISKIESNAMELKPQPYTRPEFVQQLNTLISPLCAAKKITFVTDFDEKIPPCLVVDKLRFNQIFFNLLSNAVKFTPEQGRIVVAGKFLGQTDDIARITFTVADNGIGMSEEFQKKMFESFTQEEQHISNQQGTGLGLSIVKSLVELMGGGIRVESALGKGTTFYLDMALPVAPMPEKPAPVQNTAYETQLRGKCVLLAEDHPLNRQLASRLLTKIGVRIETAENGQECVDKFEAAAPQTYDAILMDIRMPVLDGLSATAAIRALPRPDAKTVPIIAMTADAFADDAQKCFDAGMNAHLSKPIEVEKLYAALGSVMS